MILKLVSFMILGCAGYAITTASKAEFHALLNVNMKFVAILSTHTGASLFKCFTYCTSLNSCVYISYNELGKLCYTHGLNQTVVQVVTGWSLYYKSWDKNGHTVIDLMTGAIASQSSTFYGKNASLALDGNTVSTYHLCAHTDDHSSYWIMEFGEPGVVNMVDIYLRTDSFERNSNRTALVAQTYDDAVNNVGTECGRYFGPPITTSLLTLKCERPIYGRYLRLSYAADNYMDLCEVIVYTP